MYFNFLYFSPSFPNFFVSFYAVALDSFDTLLNRSVYTLV